MHHACRARAGWPLSLKVIWVQTGTGEVTWAGEIVVPGETIAGQAVPDMRVPLGILGDMFDAEEGGALVLCGPCTSEGPGGMPAMGMIVTDD